MLLQELILYLLIKEEFKGDYDKWTWVEGGILLQIHIDHYKK